MISTILTILDKFQTIYSNMATWIVAVFAFLASYLGDAKDFVLYIFFAVVTDLVLGIWRSLKQGVKIEVKGVRSKGIRSSIAKLFVYIVLLYLVSSLDKVINSESYIITRGLSALILVAEIWSIIANLAIVFPNISALSIVQKFLLAEISDKLNVDKEDVKEALDKEE